jgi:hypothetical protein
MNDKIEITEIVNRYFAALDKRTFNVETFRNIFADNATVERPHGQKLEGPEEISSSHEKSMKRFIATQHLTSGFVIDITDEIIANFRLNLVAMHLWKEGYGDSSVKSEDNYFLAGGVVSGSVSKTKNGWRILTVSNDVVWRKGVGFQQVLDTK